MLFFFQMHFFSSSIVRQDTQPSLILNMTKRKSSGELEMYKRDPALENIRVTVTLLESGALLIKSPTWVAH